MHVLCQGRVTIDGLIEQGLQMCCSINFLKQNKSLSTDKKKRTLVVNKVIAGFISRLLHVVEIIHLQHVDLMH